MKRLIFLFLIVAACSKSDPILEGVREPIFGQNNITVSDEKIENLGAELIPEKCDFVIDSDNRIWKGETRIFAGLPTEAKIKTDKKVVCKGKYIYAGLSTGELVKVNAETRNLEWTADIFAAHMPTENAIFLDIVAAPVYNNGFVYAGGLGHALCKIRDRDGKKEWCLPISVQAILKSTSNFNIVETTDGRKLAIGTDGKVYNYAD